MTLTYSLIILLGTISLIFSEEDVNVVYPNHRYFDTSASSVQTPRTFQTFTHLTQRVPVQQILYRPTQNTRLKNLTSPQTSKLELVQRSGDYQYVNVDYPQYDVNDHGHPSSGYHPHLPVLRTYPYPRYPMYDKPSSRFDISSIGVIAILKLILFKILSFGVFKLIVLFMLKFPLIIFILGFKFLIILKLIKLVKLLTIPIVIPIIIIIIAPILIVIFLLLLPLIIPFLLAPIIPLIILPMLLPLLLSLPVPVLAPTTGTTTGTTGRRRRYTNDLQSRNVQDDVLYLVRRVLESEQCIERVACQFAASKQSQGFATFVAWYLEKAAGFINKPRFTSYKDAYKKGAASGVTPHHCMRLYACNNPRNAL